MNLLICSLEEAGEALQALPTTDTQGKLSLTIAWTLSHFYGQG